MIRTTLAAATLATLPGLAPALDIEAMTESERTAFRAEIRAYLLENPEVLMEAIGVLEAREASNQAANDEALVTSNLEALLTDQHSWVGGNPDGDVTIVEFLDYRCGFCRRAFPEVEELVATDGNIRLIVKEFPILGDQSTLASRFAIATKLTAGDAAYKAVHDGLMTFRGQISPAALNQLATDQGLDPAAINAAAQLPAVDEIIAENRALAQAMRITGTPTFVIGGQMVRGFVPLDGMREIVADERG